MEQVFESSELLAHSQKWYSPRWWTREVAADFKRLFTNRFVIHNLVTGQIKIRYHRSVFGFLWTFLHPLLLLTVQAIAFSQVLKIGLKDYAIYLFSGLVAWQFFSAGLDSASRSMIASEGIIRKVAAPKLIFPVADMLVSLMNLSFAFLALILVFVCFNAPFYPQIILLIPGTILLAAFTFGLSLLAMTLVTLFRDVTHILAVLLLALYFISPVLYPPSMVGPSAWFLVYNPMSYYLEFFHNALVGVHILVPGSLGSGAVWPPVETWYICGACSLAALMAGYFTYKSYEHEYIFRL